jgi:hypothetical protein
MLLQEIIKPSRANDVTKNVMNVGFVATLTTIPETLPCDVVTKAFLNCPSISVVA